MGLGLTGCFSVSNDLWYDYKDKTIYAGFNVPISRDVIIDTLAGDLSGSFIPVGSAVEVEELTADHLAVQWRDSTLFLLFRGHRNRRDQIESVFSFDPGDSRLAGISKRSQERIRQRHVGRGMNRGEVVLSWGPPPRKGRVPAPGAEVWLYPKGGNWRVRVEFLQGLVTSVTYDEGKSPLVPDPYPGLSPRRKRPFHPW